MRGESDIERVIALLETQRGVLGDSAIDLAIATLRARVDPTAPTSTSSPVVSTPVSPGAADASAPIATEPKLRQVSVLFCDIVDSTAMLGRVAAEDAALIVGEPLTRFASIVAHAGGRVLRFTGDGLKAAFGSERASEDDAERAVRAGLEILAASRAHAAELASALGLSAFAVRVGINTGPVLLGAGPESDKAAMGHAVHIAARLEQSAPPGRLRIADTTWRLVRDHFEVESPSIVTVKGSDEPLRTYLVVREIEPHERRFHHGIEGVRPELTGRDAEIGALLAATVRARESGLTQIVTVIGDAGLGKSRLAAELVERLPSDVPVLRVRGHVRAVLQPYGLLRELVARWLGITDGEPMASARARLVERLAPLFDADGEVQAQRVGQLIGLDFSESPFVAGVSGRELRERGFAALAKALERLAHGAAARPLVLLVDDLHWADDGSLDFLEQLGDRDAPIALIALARPTLAERRAAWAETVHARTVVQLAPLAESDATSLAAALLARIADAPASLGRMLVERAHGNPFFLEELVRMLIDDGTIVVEGDAWRLRANGIERLRLPETLVGVLQARLDALPGTELAALQQAAIVGPVFWDDALAALDEAAAEALPALIARSLVVPRSASVFEGCAELRFFHPLLHEVTYGTVLKAPRRAGHGRAARWLAARVGERAGEFLGLTGEHFERAGESSEALDYFERASVDSIRRCAYEAAWAYTERELAQPALDSDPERRYWTLSRCQMIGDFLGDMTRKERAIAEMQALVETTGSDRLRASWIQTRSAHAERTGHKNEAKALAREAVELAERSHAESAGALSHGMLAWLALEEREFATVEHHVEAGIRWARRSAGLPRRRGGYKDYEVPIRIIRIESLIAQGRIADAAAEIDRALALLSPESPSDRHALLARRALMLFELGDLAGAEDVALECLVLARQLGRARLQAATLRFLGDVYEAIADPFRTRDAAIEAGQLARECHAGDVLDETLALEGSAWFRLGEVERGRGILEAVLSRARGEGVVAVRRDALARLAAIDCATGETASALARAEELLADRDDGGSLPSGVLHVVWQVLRAASDDRAEAVLEELRSRLAVVVAQVSDDQARTRLVTALPHWRDVAREPAPAQCAPSGDGSACVDDASP